MNVIFAGYRQWSYDILINLLKVKTNAWRIKSIITPRHPEAPFKTLGLNHITFDANNASDPYNVRLVTELNPNVILFYGWSWMVPKALFSKSTCLALHTSPLPKYRGGSPLQHQIIAGETTSAATIFRIEEGLDTGPIYSQIPFSLAGTLDEIFNRIVKMGTKGTIEVLNSIAANTIEPVLQQNKNATVFKRRKPGESELTINDFKTKSSKELYNFIRSLQHPYPQTFIKCRDGKKLYITQVSLKKSFT